MKTLFNFCQLHLTILVMRYDVSLIRCTFHRMSWPNYSTPALYAGNPIFKSQSKGQLSWM